MNTRSLLSIRPLSFAIACALCVPPLQSSAAEAELKSEFKSVLKPALKTKAALSKPNAKGQLRYIIRLQSAPLALYRGDKAGLAATSPKLTGEQHLNAKSAASLNYQAYLTRERSNVLQSMRASLQRDVPALKTYGVALNGFVAELTPAEAQRVAHLPGVVKVTPDHVLKPLTDRGPTWIRANTIWNGKATGVNSKGEGVVVGILDTGINPANPSFADIGGDGYDHSNPKGRRFGVCDPANPHYDSAFACNDKLIGAYDMTFNTPDNPFTAYDIDSHGSHTASTAAGNFVDAFVQAPTTALTASISGVAPHANLITYRVCETSNSCSTSNSVAAIEQAILDGVDVINFSIGSDTATATPWGEDDNVAFLSAHDAGIVVANSAGNAGPGAGTVGSPQGAPWLMSVAASTHDRVIKNGLTGLTRADSTNLADLAGKGMTTGYGPAAIVYAGQVANPNDTTNASGLCAEPYPANTFHGEIVVCDRGIIDRVDKGANVLAGGAGGMVLVNVAGGADETVADQHVLPATHLNAASGQILKNWLAQSSGHQGTISPYQLINDRSTGDIMAGFSSRGPNLILPDLLKPDLAAPGVDILAAGGVNNEVLYELMSGTSMASPHVAGSAALLKSLHADWTVDEIKSALMTTAKTVGVRDSNGKTPANPFARGAGRVDLYQAARAGLVMNETSTAYLKSDPAKGGDPASLNLPSMAENTCVLSCSWQRTVRNPGPTTVTWNAAGQAPATFQLAVTPTNFSLAPGASQTLTISADKAAATALNAWRFGQVVLTADQAGIPAAHLPVAVNFTASKLPARLSLTSTGGTGSTSVPIKAGLAASQVTSKVNGLVPAVMNAGVIHQNEQLSLDINVAQGKRRLVAEFRSATSPDLDIYVYYVDAAGAENLVCVSAAEGSNEYCNIDKPQAGTYRIYVDGYLTTDASGVLGDDFVLSTGVVGVVDARNLSSVASPQTLAAGESFNLNLQWNVNPVQTVWYGALSIGTDATNAANLGKANVDLYLN